MQVDLVGVADAARELSVEVEQGLADCRDGALAKDPLMAPPTLEWVDAAR